MTYPIRTKDQHVAEVESRFIPTPLSATQVQEIEDVTQQFQYFARYIAEETPAGREQSLALTALQESMFWASDAIARAKVEEVSTR